MTSLLKRYWQSLVLIATTVLVTWLLMRGCGQPVISPAQNEIKAYKDSLAAYEKRSNTQQAVIANLSFKDGDNARKIDSFQNLFTLQKSVIKEDRARITGLLTKINDAEKNKDTSSYYTNCDSIVQEYNAMDRVFTAFESVTDSTIKAQSNRIAGLLEIQSKLSAENIDANNTMFNLSRNFNNLSTIDAGKDKIIRRDKVIRKIQWALIAGLVAKILIFK